MPDKKEKPEKKGLTDEEMLAKYGNIKFNLNKNLKTILKNTSK